MLNLPLSQIAKWCDGQLVGDEVVISSVTIDSRTVGEQSLFFALKGERVDGHQYIAAAQENGAVAALVTEQQDLAISQIVVTDAEKALADIAAAYRALYQGKVVAITGSSGKTTTRNMLSAMLKVVGKVSETLGNFNNDLGLPLSVLAADLSADFWLLEMGAAEKGDISRLMRIAKPDVAAITQIGVAHIGRFGSQEAIRQTKGEIYQLNSTSIAVINADDKNAQLAAKEQDVKNRVSFSIEHEQADVWASDIQAGFAASYFTIQTAKEKLAVNLPVAGKHNIANALCASACVLALGQDLAQCKNGLEQMQIEQGRLQLAQAFNGAKLIDDSYNANPASVKAAIDVLALHGERKVLVLGDMGELGEQAKAYHREVGDYAKQQHIDCLFTTGELSQAAQAAFGAGAKHFASKKDLLAHLLQASTNSDVILVKGSRSAAMEQVVKGLEQGEAACC